MKLYGSIIYYWFQRMFPDSLHLNPASENSSPVDRPLFFMNSDQINGHIVIVNNNEICSFCKFHRNAFPVFLGCSQDIPSRYTKECILLNKNVSVNSVFNCLQKIFDRYEDWSQKAAHAVNESFSFDAIIRSCDTMLEAPMALSDNHFRYVSYSRELARKSGYEERYVDDGNYLPVEYINFLTAMPDYRKTEQYTDIYQYTCIENMLHKNIFHNGTFVGRLSLPYPQEEYIYRYYRVMLNMVSLYVEQLYNHLGSFWHRKSFITKLGNILQDILNGTHTEMSSLYKILAIQGYQNGDRFQLIQIVSHFTSNESKLSGALTSHLEKLWPGCCCIAYHQKLIVFINISFFQRSTNKLLNQELAVFLRESLLIAGVSRSFTKISNIRAAYLQTDIALEIGQHLNPTYWYFNFDDYAFWELIHHGCRKFLPEQICSPVILILQEYDKKNHTELNHTLKIYIAKQYNAVKTAEELCIARSTFLKRFDRIEKLTGLDLQNLEQRIYLCLSYVLFEQYNKEYT